MPGPCQPVAPVIGRPRSRPRLSLPALAWLAAAIVTGVLAAGSAGARAQDASPGGPGAIDVTPLGTWQGRDVTGLELAGVPDDLRSKARSGLALTPRRKLFGTDHAVLTLERAREDARRLLLLLARSGFPDATIGAAAAAAGERGVEVTFEVDPGPAVRYGEVGVQGLPEAASAGIDSLQLYLTGDRRFRDQHIERVKAGLDLAMQRAGHARPEVTVEIVRTAPDRAAVTFHCEPGSLYVYQRLAVQGVPSDIERLVRRVVDLEPGTGYTPRIADEARRHVRKLGLFRFSRITSEVSGPGTLDLVADLEPRKMITLEAGVGSFTDNWYVLSGSAKHRNLFGRGRGVELSGQFATHEREVALHTWWPALLTPRSRADLELRRRVEDEDAYRLAKNEVELSNLFERWRHSSLRLGVTLSDGELEARTAEDVDEDLVTQDGLQTVWSALWYRDTSDSPLSPRIGSRYTLQGDVSVPGVLTEAPFAGLRAVATRYLPAGPRRTLALRLDAAWARPLGDAAALRPDRRWYAGGVSTMRGYGRRELGPRDADGNALGGEVRLLAGAELRAMIRPPFGMAVFVDSGQVWAERGDLDLGDLALATGVGLLVETPVGPIRLDLAFNLTETPQDVGDWKLQFAIGHPY